MSTITHVEIWERLIQPDKPDMAPEIARQFLKLHFVDSDVARMNDLAAKNRSGTLTPEERSELDEYLLAGGILELLHAKARLVLARAGQAA